MSLDNGDCSGMGGLGAYILVTTALNSSAVIVLIVVVVVALWKIYRRQSSIIAWILDVDKEAGDGRFHFGHRGSSRGAIRDTYKPIRSSSPETVHDELAVPPSPSEPDEARQDRSSGGKQGNREVVNAVKCEGAVGGLGQKVKPTLTRKNKRSLSLPRSKTKRTLGTANHHLDMKRITYELNKTEQFQRTSAECDVPGSEEQGTPPRGAFGTLERHTTNRAHKDQAGDGNEYAMSLIGKVEPACKPAQEATKGNPFYFQLNNGASPETDVDATGGETRKVRGRRSMSDASFIQSAVSRFPLKMIFDKPSKPSKQRQTKKAKSEDQPLPLVMESTQDNEYERINRESSLVNRSRHAAVAPAESGGEYSKLNRKVTKDNGVVPADGYDRISTDATPISPD